MKPLLALFTFLTISFSIYGAEGIPYLSSIKGTLYASVLETQSFEFSPGTLNNCKEQRDVKAYRCEFSALPQFKIVGKQGLVPVWNFSKVNALFMPREKESMSQYIFFGTSKSEVAGKEVVTAARLILTSYSDNPNKITGYLELTDQDMKASLLGEQTSN